MSATKLYCDFFGHNYKMTKKVTNHVKEYTCSCCKKQLTTNSNGQLIELTPKYQEINSALERIYNNRMLRSKRKILNSSIY
jgi:transposase-like protein